MIISVDIETYKKRGEYYYPVLDATQFSLASIAMEGRKKQKVFYDKNELWEFIKQLGQKEQKRQRTLSVYSHNAKYDWYGYANLKDKNIKIISHDPFIVKYIHNNKTSITFLDSYAIHRMPLKNIAEMLQIQPKGTLPPRIKQLKELEEYCKHDSQICLQSILWIKQKLKELKIPIRRLYTISQIANQVYLNRLKWPDIPQETKDALFEDQDKNLLWKPQQPDMIHEALRGGTIHAKTGKHENTTKIDNNGLYSYAKTTMRMPDLRTETITYEPLNTWTQEELLNKIGISRCLVENINNERGFLQVRIPKSNYNPRPGKLIIGTWTHQELKRATQTGYKIHQIEWSITFKETQNPYKITVPEMAKLKKEAKTPAERQFWKSVENNSAGKLAQRKTNKQIIIDDIEEAEEYLRKKYKMTQGIEGTYNVVYEKETTPKQPKSYYAPIILALITGEARTIMDEQISKIPYNDWKYTDTDSIAMTNWRQNLQNYQIGNELGQFKIEDLDKPMSIHARKTYMIGNEIKVAGVRTRQNTPEDYEKGQLQTTKMITLKNCTDTTKIGKFTKETRNLKQIRKKYEEAQQKLDQEQLHIDYNLEDINYFLNRPPLDSQVLRYNNGGG